MADTLEAGQLFDVDMDHVAGALPLVAPHRRLGIKVLESTQRQGVHHPPDCRQGRLESLGEATKFAALVPEVYGLLQLLRIERPPLAAANSPSIHQRRHAACSVAGQPLVGDAQADAHALNAGWPLILLAVPPLWSEFFCSLGEGVESASDVEECCRLIEARLREA